MKLFKVPEEIVESTAVRSLGLDGKSWLAGTFNRSREDLVIAASLWEQVLGADELPSGTRNQARNFLGLSYMGLGRCSEAVGMFRDDGQALDEMGIADTFNYGMASWGVNGVIEAGTFRRVVELDGSSAGEKLKPNYLQCMAIAYWAAGDSGAALDRLDRAQEASSGLLGRTEFSCWRYLQVNAKLFEADLGEIRDLVENGGARMPRFVGGTSTGTLDS